MKLIAGKQKNNNMNCITLYSLQTTKCEIHAGSPWKKCVRLPFSSTPHPHSVPKENTPLSFKGALLFLCLNHLI